MSDHTPGPGNFVSIIETVVKESEAGQTFVCLDCRTEFSLQEPKDVGHCINCGGSRVFGEPYTLAKERMEGN